MEPLEEPEERPLSANNSELDDLEEPKTETPFVLEIPQPQEPEESEQERDWAESALFEFVKKQHFAKLIKKGLITKEEAKAERPDTPDSQKGMSIKERQEYNLK